nr:hypothetical protein CFP56_46726 [Quercus suber]
MRSAIRLLFVALMLVCSLPSTKPYHFHASKDKNFQLVIKRWDQPRCLGEGPRVLGPRKVIQHDQCISFYPHQQKPQEFLSFRNKYMKHWDNDQMWMFGTCRLKVWEEFDCEGDLVAEIRNDHVDACHSLPRKALSLSLFCDYNKPVPPGTRYWDTQNWGRNG